MLPLTLSELKRLTPPFSSASDEAEAAEYWSKRPCEERSAADRQLLREFYRLQGKDIVAPMDKSVFRRTTLEEKNRDHEEWHAAFDRFLQDR
jgi:hypothetical protein